MFNDEEDFQAQQRSTILFGIICMVIYISIIIYGITNY